jgi:pathogenesis-related protein 1
LTRVSRPGSTIRLVDGADALSVRESVDPDTIVSQVSRLLKHLVITLALASLAAGCAATGGTGGTGDLRPLDRPVMRALVDDHDTARHSVRPAVEPPLTSLAWSEPLAQTARAWAASCRFKHNGDRGNVGENLFATTVTDTRKAVEEAVESWVAERKDYDHRQNRCASGKVCGHYTQVVWRHTRRVGCAVASCTGGSPLKAKDWMLVVCNYDPPGNVVGERPY